MRKQLLAALLALPVLAAAQTPFTYTIRGKVGQLSAPAKIYLVRGLQPLDSATLKNGEFTLKGTAEMPVTANLIIRRQGRLGSLFGRISNRTRVFLEPGTLQVASPDSLEHATFKGGPDITDMLRLQASEELVNTRMRAVGAEANNATEAQKQDPAFNQRIQAQFELFNKELARANYDFVRANPNSWASLDALQNVRIWDLPQYATVGPLYETLSPALKNSPAGREYGDMVRGLKEIAVGQPAPAFSQPTPEGKLLSLADYRGKYVLVDFWASWCKPCREENPNVKKAYEQYQSRKFEVVGVSLDDEESRDKWLKAIKEDGLAWPQVADLHGRENAAAQSYHIRAVPQNFLIDPSGKIVAVNLRGEELNTTLAKYLK